jgi:hypothetical protein
VNVLQALPQRNISDSDSLSCAASPLESSPCISDTTLCDYLCSP